MTRLLQWFHINPRKLFFVDGAGALISASFHGLLLPQVDYLIGINVNHLYFLAVLPMCFVLFNTFVCFRVKKNLYKYFAAIAFFNLSFCLISLFMAVFLMDKITGLGWTYITLEIVLVSSLALFELKVSKILPRQ